MPLIKGKSERAFKKNVKTEMEHGKPQDQALAIAYATKRRAQHKKMAKGGRAYADTYAHNHTYNYDDMMAAKGVHKIAPAMEKGRVVHGKSEAGEATRGEGMFRRGKNPSTAKVIHEQVLSESRSMPKPKLKGLAEGGIIKSNRPQDTVHGSKRIHGYATHKDSPTGPTEYKNRNRSSDMDHGQRKGPEGYGKYQEQAQNQKGIHTPVSGVTDFPGGKSTSKAGDYTKNRYDGKPTYSGKDHPAIKEHKKVLAEMKSQPKPKLKGLAEGGIIKPEHVPFTVKSRQQLDMEERQRAHEHHDDINNLVPMKEAQEDYDQMPDEDPESIEMLSHGGDVESEESMEHEMAETPEQEAEEERHDSIAAAIMARKKHKGMHSGSPDEDRAVMMAEGGEIDIESNAKEEPNKYYHQNEDVVLKENYDEDIHDMHQPIDSNEHGDDIESDIHDMIGKIREKLRRQRQF